MNMTFNNVQHALSFINVQHAPFFIHVQLHQSEFSSVCTTLKSVQYAPILILCNTHQSKLGANMQSSLIYVQFAPFFIHMQYTSTFYLWEIQTICIYWAIRTNIHELRAYLHLGDTPNLRSINKYNMSYLKLSE